MLFPAGWYGNNPVLKFMLAARKVLRTAQYLLHISMMCLRLVISDSRRSSNKDIVILWACRDLHSNREQQQRDEEDRDF